MNFPQHTSLGIKVLITLLAFSYWGFILMDVPLKLFVEEICDNALDDDGDGLIDLNDPDCECQVIEPESLIPNPSFEEMDCCPHDRSQLDCATGWIQASEPTTDYLHTCGWMGWDDFPPPLPFPDGEGAMGFRDGRVRNDGEPDRNWKEYAGACLLGPLEAGTSYRFEFYVGFANIANSPPINITFFGTNSCDYLPFGTGNDAFGCPTNGSNWVQLGAVHVSGGAGNKWVQTFIEVTPNEDIAAIAIGPACAAVENPVSTYYFFDHLILADIRSFEFKINEIGHPCSETFLLEVPDNPELSYQWFKDGVALIGEIFPQITQLYGEGSYQVKIEDQDGLCRVTQAYLFDIPVFNEHLAETICNEDVFNFGDRSLNVSGFYTDTLKTADHCDSIVSLDLSVLEPLSDTISAKIFEGESYPVGHYAFDQQGNHWATLVSSLGCDSLVLLQLEFYNVFIPNVFSPNDDGINDLFTVNGPVGEMESVDFTIYDRWGAKIFSGAAWDGRDRGVIVNPGVFVYVARIVMDDGKERQFSGSVTVLR